MRIQYQYKNSFFDDIRDIVLNNKLTPDFQYIFEEYIPFQVFITGRTFFRGVSVVPDIKYIPEIQQSLPPEISVEKIISDSLEKCSESSVIGAVSGGVDSSTISMKYRPPVIYTGYYEGNDFDETRKAETVGKLIGAKHIKIKLEEQDFLEVIDEVTEVFGVPIGGLGPVMEYALLKKVLKNVAASSVLFGHGGDEIFMGYFFQQFIKNFLFFAKESVRYITTFIPSMNKELVDILDLMLISLINRAGRITFQSEFVHKILEPMLFRMKDPVDKLLFTSINFILPSLLHLNQQMCRSLNVESRSPFTNEILIGYAKALNTPLTIPTKQKLRSLSWGVPKEITEDYAKKGFPIPMDTWHEASDLIEEEYNNFRRRSYPRHLLYYQPEYNGLNRYTWAVAQAEMYLTRFYGR